MSNNSRIEEPKTTGCVNAVHKRIVRKEILVGTPRTEQQDRSEDILDSTAIHGYPRRKHTWSKSKRKQKQTKAKAKAKTHKCIIQNGMYKIWQMVLIVHGIYVFIDIANERKTLWHASVAYRRAMTAITAAPARPKASTRPPALTVTKPDLVGLATAPVPEAVGEPEPEPEPPVG